MPGVQRALVSSCRTLAVCARSKPGRCQRALEDIKLALEARQLRDLPAVLVVSLTAVLHFYGEKRFFSRRHCVHEYILSSCSMLKNVSKTCINNLHRYRTSCYRGSHLVMLPSMYTHCISSFVFLLNT
ncbi:unnamed protein product [Ixodes pacificus]